MGVAIILFSLTVISGGFYNKLEEPGPYVERYGRIYSIDPWMGEQVSTEAPRALICNACTTVGVFLMAYAGRRDNPVLGYRILMVGFALVALGLMGSYYHLEMKRTADPIQ